MSAIPISVLMCHPPIVVPEVGGDRTRECKLTHVAMVTAAERVVATEPEVVVVISPHAPRARSFVIATDDVEGDFAAFGAPKARVSLPGSNDAAARIAREAECLGVRCVRRELGAADHGSLVPLHFIAAAGYRGPTVRIALPVAPDARDCNSMGNAIIAAASGAGERWAVIASGDMSHRLERGAPSGYHPRAGEFDAAVVRAVESGDYRAAVAVDPELRELAAEDVIDSLSIGAASLEWSARGHELLSYEGPFGVGYLVAVLGCDELN